MRILSVLFLSACLISANAQEGDDAEVPEGGGIPVKFTLKEPGFVTLVVEDAQGMRVRNLISETEFPAGENQVFWDGLDDLARDTKAAAFSAYHVPGKVVPVGEYTIRGLVRPKIGLTYELAPYTNGKPAWFTQDKASGWLTNHSPPQGLLFVPAGKAPARGDKESSKGGQILVGSHVSEGGSGLAWLDLDGNKLHGQEWVGETWTAATHFAYDQGSNPVPGVYAYAGADFASSGEYGTKGFTELRFNELLVPSEWGANPRMTRLGTGEDRPVITPFYKIPTPSLDAKLATDQGSSVLGGLAVHDGLLVASIQPLNELLFVDARERKVLGTAALEDPRGLLFDKQGRLWALSGTKLLRFTLAKDPTVLPKPDVIVAEGLEDPQQIAFDADGNIFVSDWGTSHQVKVFGPDGRRLGVVGKPGVPAVGPYDQCLRARRHPPASGSKNQCYRGDAEDRLRGDPARRSAAAGKAPAKKNPGPAAERKSCGRWQIRGMEAGELGADRLPPPAHGGLGRSADRNPCGAGGCRRPSLRVFVPARPARPQAGRRPGNPGRRGDFARRRAADDAAGLLEQQEQRPGLRYAQRGGAGPPPLGNLSISNTKMMHSMFRRLLCTCLASLLLPLCQTRAVDLANGVVTAVPAKAGTVIDGDLSDWDLSAQEPAYISAQTAGTMNVEWAVMYDQEALYLSARVTMPGREYHNPSNPQDGFWWSDCLQVRLTSDPALPFPLDGNRDAASDRVVHLSFWKNSDTGKDFVNLTFGTKLNRGSVFNPEGSQTVIKTDGNSGYVVESRIPWAALNVPGGGNPFKPGDAAAFLAEALWIGGDPARVAMGFSKDVGTFGFNRSDAWGRLVFAPNSPGKRVRPTMAEVVAAAKADSGTTSVGVPIEITVPGDNLKVSVNIFDENGGVIREIIGGEPHPKGPLVVRWDGRDAFGNTMKLGTYRWGAYFHQGLKAEYQGSVGSSGIPYFNTLDGKGGWGGDHSNPIDAAADAGALYLLWPVSEAGKTLVKTDLAGKVIWRKNPFVGGGFGPFYAVAVDGKYVFLIREDAKGTYLVRVDRETGALLTWAPGSVSEILAFKGEPPLLPEAAIFSTTAISAGGKAKPAPEGFVYSPDSVGLAAHDGKVYLSSYSLGKIFIVDGETGKPLGELPCPGARGLAIDAKGNLLAVSYLPGKSQVLRFVDGKAVPVVTSGLEMPYDVAPAPSGDILVSDLGKSQQVKQFDRNGRLVKALGEPGGRAWQGRYSPEKKAFLMPAGLAVDAGGDLVVAESAPPKVFSRIRIADGSILNRWYGPGVYWNSTWPMPDDPRHVFYSLCDAMGRGKVAGENTPGIPDAYWQMNKGADQKFHLENGIPQPETVRATNRQMYYVMDTAEHAIFVFGKDEALRPVATWSVGKNTPKKNSLNVWVDANGDGKVQKAEESVLDKLADGSPLPNVTNQTASLHMEANGDLYFYTRDGFYVDALMNNPGDVAAPGPYTFSGETSGGRISYFPKQDEVWAYSTGMAYKVEGFKGGKVVGESRASGTVKLDQAYAAGTLAAAAPPMQIVPMTGSPLTDPDAWKDVPVSMLKKNDKPLASAQVGYDKEFLYARIAVTDPTPLENGAIEGQVAFKHAAFYQTLYASLCEHFEAIGVAAHLFMDSRPVDQQGIPWKPLLDAIGRSEVSAVIGSMTTPEELAWLQKLPVPLSVFCTARIKTTSSVDIGMEAFLRTSLARLKERKCRSVALISGGAGLPDFGSFLRQAKACGLETRPEWTLQRDTWPEEFEEFGFESFQKIWSGASRPDGLIVFPDNIALGGDHGHPAEGGPGAGATEACHALQPGGLHPLPPAGGLAGRERRQNRRGTLEASAAAAEWKKIPHALGRTDDAAGIGGLPACLEKLENGSPSITLA